MVGPLKFCVDILTELQNDVKNFVGGNLKYFDKIWYKYIKDKYTLNIITNDLKLDLKELPNQNSRSFIKQIKGNFFNGNYKIT